jgi:hypothetical protein
LYCQTGFTGLRILITEGGQDNADDKNMSVHGMEYRVCLSHFASECQC